MASSPCYQVDLSDGFDEQQTDEIRLFFECLNAHQHLVSLIYTVETIEETTPSSNPVGVELALGLNRTSEHLGGNLLESITELPQAPDMELVELVSDAALEVIYGVPATVSRVEGFDTVERVADGALTPLGDAIPDIATALLHTPPSTRQLWAERLEAPALSSLMATIGQLAASENSTIERLARETAPALGKTIQETSNARNNRWPIESGNSLREATQAAIQSDWILENTQPVTHLLNDQAFRQAALDEMVSLHNEGFMVDALEEIQWLTEIDEEGGPLSSGEESALAVALRLFYSANRGIHCRVDLWLGSLEVGVDNAAVTLLETIAAMDPEVAISTSDWVAGLLGSSISNALLEAVADTGVCEGLTPQMVSDIAVLETLFSDRTEHFVQAFVRLLGLALDEAADGSNIPEIVHIVASVHEKDLVHPIEELLRDSVDESTSAILFDWVVVLQQPDQYELKVEDFSIWTLHTGAEQLSWWMTQSGSASPLAQTLPVVEAILTQDGLWLALHRLAIVLSDERSVLSSPLSIIEQTGAGNTWQKPAAEWLECNDCVTPFLRVFSVPSVGKRILSADRSPNDEPPPLAFLGHLLTTDAFTDLLNTLSSLSRQMGAGPGNDG